MVNSSSPLLLSNIIPGTDIYSLWTGTSNRKKQKNMPKHFHVLCQEAQVLPCDYNSDAGSLTMAYLRRIFF